MALVLMVAGGWSGVVSIAREEAVLEFHTVAASGEAGLRLTTDPRAGRHGWWALALADPPEKDRPRAVPMLVTFEDDPGLIAGEWLLVEGRRIPRSGRAGGRAYSGVVTVTEVVHSAGEKGPWWLAGNAVRRRALEPLRDAGPRRALLAGFLVGDTSGLSVTDIEAIRRTGLAHLVAVSGRNVALFLGLALVALGPLAAGPRRRAAFGLAALVVLTVATRFTPSVVRASVMAGLLLVGRVGGWALDAATALAVTVVLVVVTSGAMATDVGFTLSALATLGVLVGSRLRPKSLPRPLAATLGATVGAQVAVAPVLLSVFGSVPLMAPVTNMVAGPMMVLSTAVGAVGVASGIEPLISLAEAGAGVVLAVARLGASWPQLGWAGAATSVAVTGLLAIRRTRPAVALAGAVMVAIALVGDGARTFDPPAAVVFDVGQGDAVVVMGAQGATMLVDGGPDPALLGSKLASSGITSLDLVVLTHVHADHAAGLLAVVGRMPVGEMWLPAGPHRTSSGDAVAAAAESAGVAVRSPPVGSTVRLDDVTIEVLGPVRRYAGPNDQSVVLRVRVGNGPTLLLTGDVETHAQADLVGIEADILKVPHQGAATSDLDWLAGIGASLAVIPVGPNQFGHPAPEVVATLEESGATVKRTDMHGDVVVPLASSASD